MSEQHDPIRTLESFGTGGVDVAPLPPSEVRRLGNRRRARRRTTTVLVAAAATAAVLVPLGIALGDGPDSTPPITRTPTPSPTQSPTPTPSPPADIVFPGPGIAVKTASDLSKLAGTSDAFQAFVGTVLDKDRATCPQPEIDVMKYNAAGYAAGAVGGCGGYQALWTAQDGQWREALGTQDQWRCADLARVGVPQAFAGACSWPPFGPHAVDGLKIGMTAEEITSAGGTVQGKPGDDCRGVVMPGFTKVTSKDPFTALMSRGKLALLWAGKGVRTPEGIAEGSTEAQVRAAFPQGHLNLDGYFIVPIDAGSEYSIGLNASSHTVSELALQTTGRQYCVG